MEITLDDEQLKAAVASAMCVLSALIVREVLVLC